MNLTAHTIGINIAAALLKAQRRIVEAGGVKKTAENPHFKSSFADRSSVLDAVLPILNEEGIALVQLPVSGPEGTLSLATSFVHESGEAVTGTAEIPLQKNDPQGYGSAITYGSRYAVVVGLGLKTLDDDDGNAGSGPGRSLPRTTERKEKPENGSKPGGLSFLKKNKTTEAPAEKAEPPVKGKTGLFPVPK